MFLLKVLSYWNLNDEMEKVDTDKMELKVLSYWNLNFFCSALHLLGIPLKYYHIGI